MAASVYFVLPLRPLQSFAHLGNSPALYVTDAPMLFLADVGLLRVEVTLPADLAITLLVK